MKQIESSAVFDNAKYTESLGCTNPFKEYHKRKFYSIQLITMKAVDGPTFSKVDLHIRVKLTSDYVADP